MLCWILALPVAFAFYFVYGIVEEIIRKRRKPANPRESKPSIEQSMPTEPTDKHDWTLSVHGYDTLRGYDSSELFREDTLIRLREIYRKVAQHKQNIEKILAEMKRRTP